MTAGFDCHDGKWGELNWSQWIDLKSPLNVFQKEISTGPGFYRVRGGGQTGLVYVGQTGRSLRGRTRALARGTFRERNDPPWNDPHTAAPILWAFHYENGLDYEVSVALAELDTPTRQCREDYLLYLHRLECGASTLANHGRRHPWWTRPTNERDGVKALRVETPIEYPSISVAQGGGSCHSMNWLNLDWTEIQTIGSWSGRDVAGVYRILTDREILYCGQTGNMQGRFRMHRKDPRFADGNVSVREMPDALFHQLKEIETDLIGAVFAETGKPPSCQYRPD